MTNDKANCNCKCEKLKVHSADLLYTYYLCISCLHILKVEYE